MIIRPILNVNTYSIVDAIPDMMRDIESDNNGIVFGFYQQCLLFIFHKGWII